MLYKKDQRGSTVGSSCREICSQQSHPAGRWNQKWKVEKPKDTKKLVSKSSNRKRKITITLFDPVFYFEKKRMNYNDVMVLRKGSMISRLSFWLVGLLLRHPYTHDTNFKELLGSHNPISLFLTFLMEILGWGLIQSNIYISEKNRCPN